MLSKQVNFFSTKADVKLFLNHFDEKGVLMYPYQIKFGEDVKQLNKLENIETNMMVMLISDTLPSKINYDFYEGIQKHVCWVQSSEIIEYSIHAETNENEISPSRFYYNEKFYRDDLYVVKDEKFTQWVKHFYNNFKKRFLVKHDSCRDWYVTKSVYELINAGKLVWDDTFNSLLIKNV